MSEISSTFNADQFFAQKPILICDIETYKGFFLIAFKRVGDGKVRTFELSDRSTIDREQIRAILMQNRIVTYNGMSYDMPLMWYFIDGAGNSQLKQASDRIIQGGVKYWDVEDLLRINIPRHIEHWDLIEPQPNAFASLKTLQGRLHGLKMQDLPIAPDAVLTHADMDLLTRYCINDLDATLNLFNALKEPLVLRAETGREYGMNFMCKSDAQMGEAIIKKRVEHITRERAQRIDTPPGTTFGYQLPTWADRFRLPELVDIVDRLRGAEFIVKADGKVDLPHWLDGKHVTIGLTTYALGIGGLHSTESNRTIHSNDTHVLIDADVEAQYPNIILSLGLYPKSVGPHFISAYRSIKDERVAAKIAKKKNKDQSLKIALNGGGFGKLGSKYSVMYAPHLLIGTTITGQLSLLWLIQEAEAAGISVMSGNTDGVVFQCPRELEGRLMEITAEWEAATTFKLEYARYLSVYSQSVNSYIAIKEDGTAKRKGPLANPYKEGIREQLMKNPNMGICSDAVVEFLTKGTPIEDTIHAGRDIRDFVTVVNVKGGGTWRGEYLGKVVRYIWATDGEEILYKTPHPTTGNFKKVSKTDGCRPLMELPDEFPADIDFDRYIAAARDILMDIGFDKRPEVVKPIRITKANAFLFAAALAV